MKPEFQWTDPVVIVANRTCDELFKLYQANGKPAAIAANAVPRFKLAAKDDDPTPLLDIDSVTPLAGGSIITVISRGTINVDAAVVQVRFAQGDTAGLAPRDDYFGEIGVVDSAETNPANAFKRAGYGVVIIKPSPGGNVGLAP
jgi:hypothetical protein